MQHHMQMPLADAEHFHANDWPPSAAPFGSGGFGGEGFGSEGFSGQGFGGEGFGRGDGGGGGGFGSESFGAASEPGYRAGLELPAPPPRRPVTLMDPSGAV